MLHKMGVSSNVMYMAGIASIGLSVASWLTSQAAENAGTDRADRWGIFVGEWAPTFFAIGVALRIEETHMDQRPMEQEKLSESYNEGRMPSRAGV
ncbi:hypothetical protein [Streptosporangium lutulentum]|uniref:Uncharacterized protein n=1 Tax=Streptosporangium lutulentum TaxID=1461250 RepID=A0ABT9QTB5_9ACTN|nr:hypothetical protein [Streptosporangium lutulentum]MDP9849989.1 hypothetical protein [Streptosporangium lutulentum]